MKDHCAARLVIIGGSAEAAALAMAVPGATVWLPQPERVMRHWPSPPMVAPLCARRLAAMTPSAVLIAPHPCDAFSAWAAMRAARAAAVPYALIRRPAWRAQRRDLWRNVPAGVDVRQVVPKGARVFVTLGRDGLPGLRGLQARAFVRRLTHAPGYPPLRAARYVSGRGPFDTNHEVALLRKFRIDWLITRNAGGSGGWPKLAAARTLGVPVAMIDRPSWPDGPTYFTVAEALAWTRQRISVG